MGPSEDDTSKLVDYIRQLVAVKFYGSLTIKFESGRIVRLIREESIEGSRFN